MTLRGKLADWLTGGKYSSAIHTAEGFRDACLDYRVDIEIMEERALTAENEVVALRKTMHNIASQETRSANATVKRMAAMARGAATLKPTVLQ